jgi:hypothetical protein
MTTRPAKFDCAAIDQKLEDLAVIRQIRNDTRRLAYRVQSSPPQLHIRGLVEGRSRNVYAGIVANVRHIRLYRGDGLCRWSSTTLPA